MRDLFALTRKELGKQQKPKGAPNLNTHAVKRTLRRSREKTRQIGRSEDDCPIRAGFFAGER